MTISIRFTYSISDCESGDTLDHGFCDMYGSPITDNSDDLSQVNDFDIELWNEPGDLAFLIDKALELGISEPSNMPFTLVNANCTWWSSVDGDTTYSLHIKGLSDRDMSKVNDILTRGHLSSDDYDYLESIDS